MHLSQKTMQKGRLELTKLKNLVYLKSSILHLRDVGYRPALGSIFISGWWSGKHCTSHDPLLRSCCVYDRYFQSRNSKVKI